MKKMPIKVKYILSHPIQYVVPLMQRLASQDDIDLHVIYFSDAGARDYYDPGFHRRVKWDRPLLEGYMYTVLNPGRELTHDFIKVTTSGVGRFIRRGEADLIIVHGWSTHLNLGSILHAFARKVPVLSRAEIQKHVRSRPAVAALRPFFLFPLLRRMDGFLAIGQMNKDYYLQAGVAPGRIFWAPYSIDTSLFLAHEISDEERDGKAKEIGLRDGSFRIIFTGKLIEQKRPLDVVAAVAGMDRRESVEVIFVGDGVLMEAAKKLAAEKRVTAHFLGFRNQQELPVLYSLADVIMLPSGHEPWGLVVNEAMTMGVPAVVSDVVGCGPDLVVEGESGCICPVGDVRAMSRALDKMASSPDFHAKLKQGARKRVAGFSIDRTLDGYLQAIRATAKTTRR